MATQRAALAEVPSDFDAQHTRWRQGLGIVASRFELLGLDSEREGSAISSAACTLSRTLEDKLEPVVINPAVVLASM